MTNDHVFRWSFITIFLAAISISGYFRRRARQSGEVIARASEGKLVLLARLFIAAPVYASFITYMVNPKWMAWSFFSVSTWLRWLGVVVGLGTLPLLYWVMISIGKNVSETFLTKESHVLVTHGPYRWVRHPLYSVATLALVSLSVVASNWFMMAMAVSAFAGIAIFVVPKEEIQLIRKFGSEYQKYQKRTGKFAPCPVRPT